jgi:predicted HicB family RNase H-like nuclease
MNVQLNLRFPENVHTALKIKTATERTSVSKYLEKVIEDVLSGDLQVTMESPKYKGTTALVDHVALEKLGTYAKEHHIPLNKLITKALEASLEPTNHGV